MNNLQNLSDSFQQSPWLDNLSRDILKNGHLLELVQKGVRGVTSNPTIFEHAFVHSDAYDGDYKQLKEEGRTTEAAYWELAIADIRKAADLLYDVYQSSDGSDGYVSLEVSPEYARDVQKTLDQARDLWKRVDRRNLMIKVPATEECVPAIGQLLSEGINVNVTLIFSLKRYLQVINAYMDGLERNDNDVTGVRGVASFFVSRVDTEIDARLDAIGSDEAKGLKGKAAVAQAQAAYGLFLEAFNSLAERWERLEERGAHAQRPLWASTSTKNPDYPDLLYVTNLVASNTVNTLPDQTIEAILDHGEITEMAITSEAILAAHDTLSALTKVGIDLNDVSKVLEDQGVEKFQASFKTLLEALESKQ
jgi:transaldolase